MRVDSEHEEPAGRERITNRRRMKWQEMNKKIQNPRYQKKTNMGRGMSRSEERIFKFLQSIGVKFYHDKEFPGMNCILNDAPLKIDFYLPAYRLAIEFDGIQHFEAIRNEKPHKLDRRILNDRVKDLFCLKRNITMLRIPYTQIENFKEIIMAALKK